jgi:translation initiation factor IF-3
VINDEGEMVGILDRDEALGMAKQAGLDLIEVSPNADPPVARIADWGKYNYQKTKKAKESKKNQVVQELKQMRIGLKIGQHDLDVKLNKINKFLDAGNKVRFVLLYRGRERAHKELGFKLFESIIAQMSDDTIVEQQPTLAGNNLSMTVRRSK